MACNCKHMEQEIEEYKSQIETLRKLFVQRMTVDSETQDRRRRDYNQAIFFVRSDEDVDRWNKWVDDHPTLLLPHHEYGTTVPVFENTDMAMVLRCFDNAVKDWRRTFCDVENCRRK